MDESNKQIQQPEEERTLEEEFQELLRQKRELSGKK